MTLEDLLAQFKAGFRERLHAPLPRPEGDEAIRAGIRAVVEALRDELTSVSRLRDVQRVFEEILASEGVEAGTHGSPELDEDARKLKALGQEVFAPAAAPSAQSDIAKAFEAEMRAVAAPDVCEWTPRGIFHGARIHAAACDGMVRATFGFTHCPTCKRAISFKSEAAR